MLSELSIEAARLKATNEAYEISLDEVEQVVKILLSIIRHGKSTESLVTDDSVRKSFNNVTTYTLMLRNILTN